MFLCECVYLCVCMCISLCEHVYVKALLPSKPLPHLLLTTAVGLGKVLEGAGPALGSEKALLNCQSLASPVPSSAGRPVPAGLLCGGHERWLCAQSLGFRPGSPSRPRQVTGPPGVSCPLDPEAAPCVSSHSCFSGPPDIRPQSTSRKVLAWVRFWVHSLCAHVLVGGGGGADTRPLSPRCTRLPGAASSSPAGPGASDPPFPGRLPWAQFFTQNLPNNPEKRPCDLPISLIRKLRLREVKDLSEVTEHAEMGLQPRPPSNSMAC